MKLSIVVPVYNMAAEGKLEYCINSLLNQTIDDYEIIAVDDASTDDSFSVLKRMESLHPDLLKVIHSPENLRQGGAKNIGIKAAKGEWLGIVDSDDWVAPTMYEKLLTKALETGADVVGCDYSLVYEHTMEPGEIQCDNDDNQMGILDEEKYRNIFLASGSMVIKIYKRSIITNNALWYPEHIFYEDNCMSPLWLLHCTHFEHVPEPLYFYYQHDASTIHYVSLSKCKDRVTAMNLLVDKCKEMGYYNIFLPELEIKYTELCFVNTLFSLLHAKTRGRYGFIRKLKKELTTKFPNFSQNPYYATKIGQEERKLIALLMKSQMFFIIYFEVKQYYRKLRKKAGK